jgi:hypothetical protein
MSQVPMTKDAMGGGFDWFNKATDSVGGLLNTVSSWEALRQQRDSRGQGQNDLANAVVTDYNKIPVDGKGNATAKPINTNTVIIAGAALLGVALVLYIGKR